MYDDRLLFYEGHQDTNEQHAVWKQRERMKEIRKERKLAIAS